MTATGAATLAVAALWLAGAVPAAAQDPPSSPGPPVTLRIGLVPILDYTWLSQDQANVTQVGVQDSAFQVRSGRILARGELFARQAYAPRYLVAFEYKGFDSDPDVTWNFTDISITFPVKHVGDVTVGKTKEPFVYEMVGDAANLAQVERLLSPFFVSRNVGVRFDRALGERMAVAAGVFNDWWTTSVPRQDSGTTLAARVTGLAWMSANGRRFLHVAGGLRRNGADSGQIRLKGRPESNITDNYVDTGNIPASAAMNYSAEALWNEGPVSLLAEYSWADVFATDAADPHFRGGYITASWVVTGEHRPYDHRAGYARRVIPQHHRGAIELVARVGLVDLSDGGVDGGAMAKWYSGVNWWATRRFRISAGGGRVRLDKGGLVGHTNQFLTRLQWVY
jgi:phosphate-selective porin OprO/OprP